MKDCTNLAMSAKAVVIFKNVLKDKGISSLIKLLECRSDNESEFLKYYSDFVSELYEKTDDLSEYISTLLLNDENIYVKQSAKGKVSPLLREAAENELDFFEELSKVKCDDFQSIYNSIALPQWRNGNISIKREYEKKIEAITTTGYGIYASHRMFLYKDEKIIPV